MTPIFPNPAVLLAFYDPFFQVPPHRIFPWQAKVAEDFARRGCDHPECKLFNAPGREVKKIMTTAPNGSGKSSFLIASGAIWTAMSFTQSQSAITSASKDQLDAQVMRSAHRLAENINSYHGADLWDIGARHMEFKPNGSKVDARKSDEEGTQEGFHPLVPGGEFSIFVDEGKSIMPDIYKGILKWTGWTRRMDITSAGDPVGTFYKMWSEGGKHHYWIIDDDCPNITEADKALIIKEGGGPNSPLAQQALKSIWAALAGSVVMLLSDVERCIQAGKDGLIKHEKADFNDAGLDLSGGGDETIFSPWNGNKQLAIEEVPFKDETKIEDHIAYVLIPKWNVRLEHIKVDAGGMGRPMARNIAQKVRSKGGGYGENMHLVYNQKAPVGVLKDNFGNLGTSMWQQFANLVRSCSLILIEDTEQTTQLANRYFRQMVTSDKLIIEPKAEAKVKGHPSPDRADAAVLAKKNYRLPEVKVEEKNKAKMSTDELLAFFDNIEQQRFVTPHPGGLGVVTIADVLKMRRDGKIFGR